MLKADRFSYANMLRSPAIASFLIIFAANSGVARGDQECALDKLIFKSDDGKSTFVTERITTREKAGYQLDTAYHGRLNGRRAVAVYSLAPMASPCCVWFSYLPGQPLDNAWGRPPPKEPFKAWRDPVKVSVGDIGRSMDLQVNHPPWKPDKGPLAGMVLKPVGCRR